MDILVDGRFESFNNLYDNIKTFIEKQLQEAKKGKEIGDMTDEEIDLLGDEFDVYNSKINYIKKLDDENRLEHIKMILEISNIEELNEKDKVKTILSYATLTHIFRGYDIYSFEELLILSSALKEALPDAYSYHLEVLCDFRLIDQIMSKGTNLIDKINLAEEIIKLQKSKPYEKPNRLIDKSVLLLNSISNFSK